jgi:alpha-amylase
VQNDLKYFLGERLRSVGFTGWRYDYAKGYSPAYTKLYNEASHPEFCVGEIWTTLLYDKVDQHRQELMQYIEGTSGTCGAFDFTSKGLLNKVLRDHDFGRLRDSLGRPAGGIGVWPQKMVTFVDNHDTGPSGACGTGQNLWPIPCDQVMPAYAYILSHPGIPSVYYPHLYDWNLRDSIRSLIQVRKSTGIQSNSAVSIQHAENGLYAAIIQGRDGRLAVRIGSRDWNPGSSWDLVTWGQHYSVWMQR